MWCCSEIQAFSLLFCSASQQVLPKSLFTQERATKQRLLFSKQSEVESVKTLKQLDLKDFQHERHRTKNQNGLKNSS